MLSDITSRLIPFLTSCRSLPTGQFSCHVGSAKVTGSESCLALAHATKVKILLPTLSVQWTNRNFSVRELALSRWCFMWQVNSGVFYESSALLYGKRSRGRKNERYLYYYKGFDAIDTKTQTDRPADEHSTAASRQIRLRHICDTMLPQTTFHVKVVILAGPASSSHPL